MNASPATATKLRQKTEADDDFYSYVSKRIDEMSRYAGGPQ